MHPDSRGWSYVVGTRRMFIVNGDMVGSCSAGIKRDLFTRQSSMQEIFRDSCQQNSTIGIIKRSSRRRRRGTTLLQSLPMTTSFGCRNQVNYTSQVNLGLQPLPSSFTSSSHNIMSVTGRAVGLSLGQVGTSCLEHRNWNCNLFILNSHHRY